MSLTHYKQALRLFNARKAPSIACVRKESFYGFFFTACTLLKHFSYLELSTISHRERQLPSEKATIAVNGGTEAIAENGNSWHPLKWSTQRNDVTLDQPFIGVKIHRGTCALGGRCCWNIRGKWKRRGMQPGRAILQGETLLSITREICNDGRASGLAWTKASC